MSSDRRVLFLTVGDMNWASSRMRSYWPASLVPEWDVMKYDDNTPIPTEYEIYVWMKTGQPENMRKLRAMGKPQIIETCDPAWWWSPEPYRQLLDAATHVVAATDISLVDMMEWYGKPLDSYVVPDRLLLDHFPKKRAHRHVTPVRFIWYGVSINRQAIFGGMAYLERLVANGYSIELTIFDNADVGFPITKYFPIYTTPWSLEKENDTLSRHDIAFLPPYPGPWGKMKSNNKQLTAWACGLPDVDGQDYYAMEYLMKAEHRQAEADRKYEILAEKYQTKHTVEQWRWIFEDILK